MNEVFINYRRADTLPYVGRLCELLRKQLGDDKVFMNEDGIPYGDKFLQVIAERLSTCLVLAAVIGPTWLAARKGARGRLFDASDTVRLEIFVALNRNIQVIPVLVGGAVIPSPGALPRPISGLVGINVREISPSKFREDVNALAGIIRNTLAAALPMEESVRQSERRLVDRLITTEFPNEQPDGPRFGQLDPDSTKFKVEHKSDAQNWQKIIESRASRAPLPFPKSRGGKEPVLQLSEALGTAGRDTVGAIEQSGRIVFHAVGSTGNTRGPAAMRVTDLALYSNVFESIGIISDQSGQFPELGRAQLEFLDTALTRIKDEKFLGAVILAIHHDLYSSRLRTNRARVNTDLDSISKRTGGWSHAVLSAYAHNYQRLTRAVRNKQIPYIVCGSGGYSVSKLPRGGAMPLRLRQYAKTNLAFAAFDDQHFGYLRITVDPEQLQIDYQPISGEIADSVVIDLNPRNTIGGKTRKTVKK